MNTARDNKVLFVGCGWLGKKLGARLHQIGYEVSGTTRSVDNIPELERAGIKAYILDLNRIAESKVPWDHFDHIFVSVSPGRGEERQYYPKLIENLAEVLSSSKGRLIYFSSTSVYTHLSGKVSEEDVVPDAQSDNPLTAAEGMLRKYRPDAMILRLGGLIGPDRHPVHYLAGRTNISDGNAPVNLIHSDDIIAVCEHIIEGKRHNGIYNVVSPSHPEKKTYYRAEAKRLGLEMPEFEGGGKRQKTVLSDKLRVDYSFRPQALTDSP